MGYDSQLIAEAVKMTAQHPICPKCHQSRMQVNDEGGKECPSCGYKTSAPKPNYRDPIGEEQEVEFKQALDDTILDCYYKVNSLSRRPDANSDVVQIAFDGLRDILKQIRHTSNQAPLKFPEGR